MNFERLEKNLCDNIYESQIKIGYDKRPMSLNYMKSSLCNLLGTELTDTEIEKTLCEFSDYSENRLGKLTFRPIKDGYCITVSEEGTAYVHNNSDDKAFIKELVEAVRCHSSFETIMNIFRNYSDDITVIHTENDEFEYLVYFSNGIPDEYRYCISIDTEIDGHEHITYHRFIKEDYEELGF